MFLEKLPLVHVETEMDAKAVVRRMRLHQKAPAAPEKTEMDVAGFNELVQAAKSDLVQQEAAAKNELEFYRGLLDIKKPRPTMDLSGGGAPSFKLPSLKPPPKQPPTNQERPTSSSSTTSSNGRAPAVRKPVTESPKATLAAIKPKPSTLKGPLATKPTQASHPRPSDEPKAAGKVSSLKPTPVPAPGPAKRPSTKTSAPPPKPNNIPVAVTTKPKRAVQGRSKKEVSTMDCLATFDDAEPEVDSAPVYNDLDNNNNGYGSDDDIMMR